MNKLRETKNGIRRPAYKFVQSGTLLFLAGVPLSGKSTVAPLITSSIVGLGLQSMDVVRLLAQEIESHKPKSKQNRFVHYGSCDSYRLIGDGSYSPASLIEGFSSYSEAVCAPLNHIIPRLEAQGAREMLFEGVQLTPKTVRPYLTGRNKLIILTASRGRLSSNAKKVFGHDRSLLRRYSPKKLLLLQEEIVKQSTELPEESTIVIDNSGSYLSTIVQVVRFLLDAKVIRKV